MTNPNQGWLPSIINLVDVNGILGMLAVLFLWYTKRKATLHLRDSKIKKKGLEKLKKKPIVILKAIQRKQL